jgi:hypothetical protein
MGEWPLVPEGQHDSARHEVPGIMRKMARPSGTIELSLDQTQVGKTQ